MGPEPGRFSSNFCIPWELRLRGDIPRWISGDTYRAVRDGVNASLQVSLGDSKMSWRDGNGPPNGGETRMSRIQDLSAIPQYVHISGSY
jgi:hypothetical protein